VSTPFDPQFVPSDGAAKWTKALLVAFLALSVVAIASGLAQIELLSRAVSGGVTAEEAAANDSRQQLISILQVVVSVGTAIAFLMWFHRAYKNLPALGGRQLKYSPGWAVGGFFVPFLNLARPLQVMREVWHGSDPSGLERDLLPEGPALRNYLGTPTLMGWWWGLFLVTSLLGNLAARMSLAQHPTLDQLQVASVLQVFNDVLEIPSVVVTIRLIVRITKWQSERNETHSSPPPLPIAPQ